MNSKKSVWGKIVLIWRKRHTQKKLSIYRKDWQQSTTSTKWSVFKWTSECHPVDGNDFQSSDNHDKWNVTNNWCDQLVQKPNQFNWLRFFWTILLQQKNKSTILNDLLKEKKIDFDLVFNLCDFSSFFPDFD